MTMHAFKTPNGKLFSVNSATVLALEPTENGMATLIVMGHSYSYVANQPMEEVREKLNLTAAD